MNEALVVLDKDGRIINFNDAFAHFCRFPSTAECLRSIDDFSRLIKASRPEGTVLAVEEWPAARALRGEEGVDVDVLIERTDTGERWLANTSFAPLRDKAGEIVGAVQSLRDVTALKEAEQVLRRSREELEDLVRRRTEEIQKKDDLIRRAQKIEALGTLAGGSPTISTTSWRPSSSTPNWRSSTRTAPAAAGIPCPSSSRRSSAERTSSSRSSPSAARASRSAVRSGSLRSSGRP